jgi:2-C-methyl-D-erythritol 4-phosphate cytidylyltransferase
VRAEAVVGQGLPVGEDGDAQPAFEEGQFVGQALRIGRLGGDDGEQPPVVGMAAGEAGEQQRVGAADGAREREALARRDGRGAAWKGRILESADVPFVLLCVDPCAGVGQRAGAAGPKQYAPLAGRALVAHTLAALAAVPRLAGTLVALAPDDTDVRDPGAGTTRSVGGALRWRHARGHRARRAHALRAQGAGDEDWVLVHDAARCLLRPAWVERLIDACLDDPVGGLLALPLTDTLKQAEGGDRVAATVDRAGKWAAQTPQMFRLALLERALDAAGCGGHR